MDTSTLFSVAPTFPLDADRIRSRSLVYIARSPVTWGALLATGVLCLSIEAGFASVVILYGLVLLGLRSYWEKQRAKVAEFSKRELIRESNLAQDFELLRIIRELQDGGHLQYACCLNRFLSLKQKVEKDLYSAVHLSGFAPDVEKGVDGICAEVCREITRLREQERGLGEVLTSRDPARLERLENARRDAHAAILNAYTSLYQTHVELLGLGEVERVKQPEEKDAEPGKRLQQFLGDLQDEADTIARTHARIQGSLAE